MYDQEKLLEILKDPEYRSLDANGKWFPSSNLIYLKISDKMKELNSHISPKHMYTILNTNRRGIYSALLKTFNLQENIENTGQDESSE